MSKSHVAMEQHQCPICLARFDTGNVLLETRIDRATGKLRQTLEEHQITGHSPCTSCQEKMDDGFVALIETRDSNPNRSIAFMDTPRSGNFAFLKGTPFTAIFDRPVPSPPIVFVEPGVLDAINKMVKPS